MIEQVFRIDNLTAPLLSNLLSSHTKNCLLSRASIIITKICCLLLQKKCQHHFASCHSKHLSITHTGSGSKTKEICH